MTETNLYFPTVFLNRDSILSASRRRHVNRVLLVASSQNVTFLADFDNGATLLDQIGLNQDLEKILKTDIEVISNGGLRPEDSSMLETAIEI